MHHHDCFNFHSNYSCSYLFLRLFFYFFLS